MEKLMSLLRAKVDELQEEGLSPPAIKYRLDITVRVGEANLDLASSRIGKHAGQRVAAARWNRRRRRRISLLPVAHPLSLIHI